MPKYTVFMFKKSKKKDVIESPYEKLVFSF